MGLKLKLKRRDLGYKSGTPASDSVVFDNPSRLKIVDCTAAAEEMHLRLALTFLLLLLSLSSCCMKALEGVGWNGIQISGSTAEYGSGDCLQSDALTCGPATFDISISGR